MHISETKEYYSVKANDKQISGTHYKKMPIEHWDLAAIFGWDYFQARSIAYIMRWKDKAGLIDLEKAGHFIQKYIEVEKARTNGTLTLDLMEAALAVLRAEDEEQEQQEQAKHVLRKQDVIGDPRESVVMHADPSLHLQNRPDIYAGKRGGPHDAMEEGMRRTVPGDR
jgi:hypothetical protein